MKVSSAAIGALVVSVGCGRVLTEEDCSQIKENIAAAWATEARGGLEPDASVSTRARSVVAAEGEHLVTEWMAVCKEELVGKWFGTTELRCIRGARTVAGDQEML